MPARLIFLKAAINMNPVTAILIVPHPTNVLTGGVWIWTHVWWKKIAPGTGGLKTVIWTWDGASRNVLMMETVHIYDAVMAERIFANAWTAGAGFAGLKP
jgi:hypothetical protein